jgi:hypothetical protein
VEETGDDGSLRLNVMIVELMTLLYRDPCYHVAAGRCRLAVRELAIKVSTFASSTRRT